MFFLLAYFSLLHPYLSAVLYSSSPCACSILQTGSPDTIATRHYKISIHSLFPDNSGLFLFGLGRCCRRRDSPTREPKLAFVFRDTLVELFRFVVRQHSVGDAPVIYEQCMRECILCMIVQSDNEWVLCEKPSFGKAPALYIISTVSDLY
jgi:hypothetical protein